MKVKGDTTLLMLLFAAHFHTHSYRWQQRYLDHLHTVTVCHEGQRVILSRECNCWSHTSSTREWNEKPPWHTIPLTKPQCVSCTLNLRRNSKAKEDIYISPHKPRASLCYPAIGCCPYVLVVAPLPEDHCCCRNNRKRERKHTVLGI